MTKRKTLVLSVTAAAIAATTLFGAGIAQARGGHGGERPGAEFIFEELDANGDGVVTQAEIDAHAAARFAKSDTDGDGNLSVEEMVATAEARMQERMKRGSEKMAKRTERMIERKDTNDDGMLSMAELQDGKQRGGKIFERMDTDGDGAISRAEFDAAKAHMMKRGGKQRGE